jgi:hypothetical protein
MFYEKKLFEINSLNLLTQSFKIKVLAEECFNSCLIPGILGSGSKNLRSTTCSQIVFFSGFPPF